MSIGGFGSIRQLLSLLLLPLSLCRRHMTCHKFQQIRRRICGCPRIDMRPIWSIWSFLELWTSFGVLGGPNQPVPCPMSHVQCPHTVEASKSPKKPHWILIEHILEILTAVYAPRNYPQSSLKSRALRGGNINNLGQLRVWNINWIPTHSPVFQFPFIVRKSCTSCNHSIGSFLPAGLFNLDPVAIVWRHDCAILLPSSSWNCFRMDTYHIADSW